jgi:hypothetical protein
MGKVQKPNNSEIERCRGEMESEIDIVTLLFVLRPIDPLLGKDLETNNETIAVAMQPRGYHSSTAIEFLLETVFSTPPVQRGYKEENWSEPVS